MKRTWEVQCTPLTNMNMWLTMNQEYKSSKLSPNISRNIPIILHALLCPSTAFGVLLQHAVSHDIMYMYVVFYLTNHPFLLAQLHLLLLKPVTNICQHVYNQAQLQLNRTGTLICLKSESNSGSASTGRILLILCRPRQEGFFLSFLPMCRWLLGVNSRAGKRTPKSSSSVEKFIWTSTDEKV